jgi:hypothetical protein
MPSVRFPVRTRIAVPSEGLGGHLDQIIAWLDADCGADGWISTHPAHEASSTTRSPSIFRCNDRGCLCALLVRSAEGRDRGWGVSVPRQRTDAARWGGPASDAVNAGLAAEQKIWTSHIFVLNTPLLVGEISGMILTGFYNPQRFVPLSNSEDCPELL